MLINNKIFEALGGKIDQKIMSNFSISSRQVDIREESNWY